MTDEGFVNSLKEINKIPLGRKKIFILGGGNAAFQCAHLLLNGPAFCDVNDMFPYKED